MLKVNQKTERLIISSKWNLGRGLYAFTGQEVTGYYAKVSPDKIDNALDIISICILIRFLGKRNSKRKR